MKIGNSNLPNEIDISEIHKLEEFCKLFSGALKGDEIVLIHGEVAAGKSEFVKQMLKIRLNFLSSSSPSYALHHKYENQFGQIDHWDLYRLRTEDELESTGFWDQLQNQNLIFIEWPERLDLEQLPKNRNICTIQIHRVKDQRILKLI